VAKGRGRDEGAGDGRDVGWGGGNGVAEEEYSNGIEERERVGYENELMAKSLTGAGHGRR
jgi:hypothetical protein